MSSTLIDSHSLQENVKSAILNDTISVILTSQGTIKCGARFVFSLRSSTGYPRKIKGVPRLQITAVNKCKELTCTFYPSMMFHNPVLPLIFSWSFNWSLNWRLSISNLPQLFIYPSLSCNFLKLGILTHPDTQKDFCSSASDFCFLTSHCQGRRFRGVFVSKRRPGHCHYPPGGAFALLCTLKGSWNLFSFLILRTFQHCNMNWIPTNCTESRGK